MRDLTGSLSCFQPLGISTVDYIITSEDLLSSIIYFQVNKLKPDLSDHCLSCLLKCNFYESFNDSKKILMPDKFIWNDKSQLLFEAALNSYNIKLKIKYLKEKGYNNEDVDTAVSDFNNILLQAAEMSLRKKKSNSSKKKKRKSHKKWFDNDLLKIK